MRAHGLVSRPDGRYDVTLDVTGVLPRVREVEDVRRIYAAAPDLLAACERIARRLEAAAYRSADEDDDLAMLRTAVAKAVRS